MKTCETCIFWTNRQREMGGYEGAGICEKANDFDQTRQDNIVVLYKGKRVKLGKDFHLVMGHDRKKCGYYKGVKQTA